MRVPTASEINDAFDVSGVEPAVLDFRCRVVLRITGFRHRDGTAAEATLVVERALEQYRAVQRRRVPGTKLMGFVTGYDNSNGYAAARGMAVQDALGRLGIESAVALLEA